MKISALNDYFLPLQQFPNELHFFPPKFMILFLEMSLLRGRSSYRIMPKYSSFFDQVIPT